jgi:hypothetical protein
MFIQFRRFERLMNNANKMARQELMQLTQCITFEFRRAEMGAAEKRTKQRSGWEKSAKLAGGREVAAGVRDSVGFRTWRSLCDFERWWWWWLLLLL